MSSEVSQNFTPEASRHRAKLSWCACGERADFRVDTGRSDPHGACYGCAGSLVYSWTALGRIVLDALHPDESWEGPALGESSDTPNAELNFLMGAKRAFRRWRDPGSK